MDEMNNGNGNGNGNPGGPSPRRGQDIADRLLRLAIGCLRLIETFPRTAMAKHIARQFTRACTSGGANYEEARGAESRADFAHKVLVSAKEVGETVYWLRVVANVPLSRSPALPVLIQEGRELVKILMASAATARARAR
jgi:four helix bundle protein